MADPWAARLEPARFLARQGRVGLPQLELGDDLDLVGILSGLGLGNVFSDAADFSAMTDASGRFRIGPFAAGVRRIEVTTGGVPRELGEVHLAKGETIERSWTLP